MSPAPSQRDLVLVSAGLALDGGGRALAGRLLAAGCAAYAAERGIGLRVLSLGCDGEPALAAETRRFGGRQGALARAVWRRQLRSRRDAYVYDLLGPARIQAWMPARLRSPYLVPLYGIEVWQPLSGARARALRQATVRLAISAYTLARARRATPDLGDTAVLPLCLEERPPAGEADGELLARLGEGFLLIVGRMAAGERYKGHDELLDALPRLQASRPGARLVVAGDGDDRARLAAKAAALGLAASVAFTGFVSEATRAELYRRAAAFVMPSRGEGFGLVYLEAMRAGTPCVAARGGAVEEIVIDGETGLLVDPGSPADLAAALDRLLGDPAAARAMGEAGHRRLGDVFTPARFRAGLWPFLDRLTA